MDGLLPGEQAVVEVFGKRNLHARLLQIKKASSKRVKPQCPAFAKCGGCKMQHLQYDSQLEWKQKTVEQLMKRYIDEGAKLYQIVGMVEPWRYRNKCHISFGMNGRRQIISGIYEENSHRVVPVESCLIQDSKADEIARSVRAIMKECKLLPYDEDSETGLLRHLLVRTGFASGQVMVVLVTASPIFPARSRFVSLLRERHPEITTIVMNCNPKKPAWCWESRSASCTEKDTSRTSSAKNALPSRRAPSIRSIRSRPRSFLPAGNRHGTAEKRTAGAGCLLRDWNHRLDCSRQGR